MAVILDEQKMIEDNVFHYEERARSPLVRFTDKTFTPTTYFHINNAKTTADQGFGDVAELLGEDSPIKFQRIDSFPLYGLESIMIALQDGDVGIDGGYEGEAYIMPGTITPSPNDYFLIRYLKDSYVFKVTEIAYDNIMPSNFFKISFMLEYIDAEKEQNLYDQTEDTFTCILENIGSEDRCIIQREYKEQLDKIDAMYDDMVSTYLTFFYNERYNCLLGDFNEYNKIYDPLQTVFINSHNLFNKKKNLKTVILTEQYADNMRKLKYEKSVYRFFERRDLTLIGNFPYTTFKGMRNPETAFYHWRDERVLILDNNPKLIDPENHNEIFNDRFVNILKMNAPTDSKYVRLLQRYMRKEELELSDIDLSLGEELLYLNDANLEVFFFTPIILYIIKDVVKDFLKREDKESNVLVTE